MHELNKNQMVLLVLLVSFVTSIATGIITTTLLQEAPPGVTQVINRVVQQTIEKVTPDTSGKTGGIKEVTVIVNEEDLVISAISKNIKSIVRIRDNSLVDGNPIFYGMGFLISKEGLIVSSNRDILNTASTFTATFSDSTSFPMKVAGVDAVNNLVFFQIIKDPKLNISVSPVILSTSVPQLGQSVIALDGEVKDSVSIGRVISVMLSDKKEPISIETNIETTPKLYGGPITNLSGEIMGIRTSISTIPQVFVPSVVIKRGIAQYTPKSP